MEYFYKERIGVPDLFTGRQNELAYFQQWIEDIKKEKSKSTAILARRKMGKTALLERLFNITFYKNNHVIPFYFEVLEVDYWVVDFCIDFFFTFIYQYMAFKSRKSEYLNPVEKSHFGKLKAMVQKEGLDYLTDLIDSVENMVQEERLDVLWTTVRNAPKTIAARQNEYIVQMIDEFQFLNDKVFWDKEKKNVAKNLAAGYLSTAESKIAPLLVTGSWVGWLMNLLKQMLPSRFIYTYLESMPEEEAIEMIFKYSQYFDVPITDETAFLIAQVSEGSPFYISSILRSQYKSRELTSAEGLAKTLEFETLDNRGEIKYTWMEYVNSAFDQINNKNAKRIVLYLCKHRDQEITRAELLEQLQLDMTDGELELKLEALIKADIILQGSTNYDYQGVKDNIFDKVFRGVYQKEIEAFDLKQIKEEYLATIENLKKQHYQLLGKFNYMKGYFAEYRILDQLLFHGQEKNVLLKSITRNLPADFDFCPYQSVWRYNATIEYGSALSVDILARAKAPGFYSIIGEVKNRDTKKFSKDEVVAFLDKFAKIKEKENLSPVIGFIFSRKGFTKDALAYCLEKGVATSSDEQWL